MIGTRLKEARKNKRMTLEQVAQIMNTTHTTLSRYETGKRKVDTDTLVQLCRLYEISADYILGLPEGLPYPKRK